MYTLQGVQSFSASTQARAHLCTDDSIVCGIDPGTRHLAIKFGSSSFKDLGTYLIDLGSDKSKVMANLVTNMHELRHLFAMTRVVVVEGQIRQNVPMARIEAALVSSIASHASTECTIMAVPTSTKDNYIKRTLGKQGKIKRNELKRLACSLAKSKMQNVNDESTLAVMQGTSKKDDIADAYIYHLIGLEHLG